MDFIAKYEASFGQHMGRNKCTYVWRKQAQRNEKIEQCTSFSRGSWPITYLDAPIATSRVRWSFFQPLVERVKQRIEGWTCSGETCIVIYSSSYISCFGNSCSGHQYY